MLGGRKSWEEGVEGRGERGEGDSRWFHRTGGGGFSWVNPMYFSIIQINSLNSKFDYMNFEANLAKKPRVYYII